MMLSSKFAFFIQESTFKMNFEHDCEQDMRCEGCDTRGLIKVILIV
jgi:hypothetical protein